MNKTEALRLADELEAPVGTQSTYSAMRQAAAELRRLHAQRDALLAALRSIIESSDANCGDSLANAISAARAAIARAQGATQ